RGAQVLMVPGSEGQDRRLAPITSFASFAALAIERGLRKGLNVDNPDWLHSYNATARAKTPADRRPIGWALRASVPGRRVEAGLAEGADTPAGRMAMACPLRRPYSGGGCGLTFGQALQVTAPWPRPGGAADAIAQNAALVRTVARQCAARSGGLLRFITTANTARTWTASARRSGRAQSLTTASPTARTWARATRRCSPRPPTTPCRTPSPTP